METPLHPAAIKNSSSNKSFFYLGLPLLVLIYGCIFFQIERWPLSDYRMFAFFHSPESIKVYRLGIAKDQQWVAWLYPEDSSDFRKNRKFYNEVIFVAERDPTAAKQLMSPHLNAAEERSKLLGIKNSQLALFDQTVILKDQKMSSVKVSYRLGLDL